MKYKTLFEQQFDDDLLFALAFHPSAPSFVVGTSQGHLSAYKYSELDDVQAIASSVTQAWTTKRHKSSCRTINYDHSGDKVYSSGSDNILKMASSETGKVIAKDKTSLKSSPTSAAVNESLLAIGDEDARLTIFDLRTLKKTHSYSGLHADNINSVMDVPYRNKYHFITCGTTTVTHIDIRKGIVSQSEDQEDEVLSGCSASDKHSAFGMSEGVVTLWNNDHLQDQQNRIRLSEGSIDCVIAGPEDNEVYAGGSEGIVRKLDIRASRIDKAQSWVHSTKEEISALDFDHKYRLVTAGLDSLKIWRQEDELSEDENSDDDKDGDEESSRGKKRAQASKAERKKKKKTAQPQVEGISKFADL